MPALYVRWHKSDCVERKAYFTTLPLSFGFGHFSWFFKQRLDIHISVTSIRFKQAMYIWNVVQNLLINVITKKSSMVRLMFTNERTYVQNYFLLGKSDDWRSETLHSPNFCRYQKQYLSISLDKRATCAIQRKAWQACWNFFKFLVLQVWNNEEVKVGYKRASSPVRYEKIRLHNSLLLGKH